jgi:hypothetical protein
MWDCLRAAGLPKAIEHLRHKVRSAKAERTTASTPAVKSPSNSVVVPPSSKTPHAIEPPCSLDVEVLVRRIVREFAPEAALDGLLAKILSRMRLGRAEHAADYDSLLREWASEVRAGNLPAGAEAPKVTKKMRGWSGRGNHGGI